MLLKVIGGKILGNRLASIVLPAPGGPIKIICHPQPLFPCTFYRFLSFTSEKSNSGKSKSL
jgi:hypothetical protein